MFDDEAGTGAGGRRLTAAVDALAAVDLAGVDAATMLAEFEQLLTVEARLRAEQIRRLQAIHTRGASVNECRATRSWLTEELRVSPGEANRRLRLARLIPDAPATAAAFAAGEINAEHASTVASG